MSILSKPYFHNEESAYKFVESNLWPNGPVCPRCGGAERVSKMQGKSTRIGAYKCYECRKPFTVKVGTIFESSHIKMHLWLQAIYMISSSKKGISSHQLHRTLGITVKSAWFMTHRIREAMRDGGIDTFGSGGSAVEVNETLGRNRQAINLSNDSLMRSRGERGSMAKKPKQDDKEQSKRFINTARELKADENTAAFEKKFLKVTDRAKEKRKK